MYLERRSADLRFLLFLVTLVAFTSSCKDATPPPPPVDVSGTWGGSASQTVASKTVADVMVFAVDSEWSDSKRDVCIECVRHRIWVRVG